MKVLFRIIIGIPVWLIIAYAMGIVAQIAAVIAWFAIVYHRAASPRASTRCCAWA